MPPRKSQRKGTGKGAALSTKKLQEETRPETSTQSNESTGHIPASEEPVQPIQDAERQEDDQDESSNADIEKVTEPVAAGLGAEDEDEEDQGAPVVDLSLVIPQPSFGGRQSSVSPLRKHSRGPSSANADKETVDDGRSVRRRTETPVLASVGLQASTSGLSNPTSLPSSPPSYQPPRVSPPSETPIGVPVSKLPSTPPSYQLPKAPTPSDVPSETPIVLRSDGLPPSHQPPRAPSPSEVSTSMPPPRLPSPSRSETPSSLPQSDGSLPTPKHRKLAVPVKRRSVALSMSPSETSDNVTSDAEELEDACGTETGGVRHRSKAKALTPQEQDCFGRLKPQLDLWWFKGRPWAGVDDVLSYGDRLVPPQKFSPQFADYTTRHFNGARGHIVAAAKSVVVDAYGLAGDVEVRKARVRYLLENNRYLIHPGLLDKSSYSLFTHPAISKTLIHQYWNTKSGWGVQTPRLINYINDKIIALVCTGVFIALKQWETGLLDKSINMKTLNARDIFDSHLKLFRDPRRNQEKMIKVIQSPIQAALERHTRPITGVQGPEMGEAQPEEEEGLDAILAGNV